MLDTLRIRSRIKEIRKRLMLLDKYSKPLLKEVMIKDEMQNASAERNLEVAIQACIDIANHIVSALGLEMPDKNISDVFYSLASENIIPADFAKTMVKVTGYRNVLVHEYTDVDRRITYDIIQNRLPDISKFVQHIEKFIEKKH